MAATQDKQPSRPTGRVVSPGSISGRRPTKPSGRRPYRTGSLVDCEQESDEMPTPTWDELLGPRQERDDDYESF